MRMRPAVRIVATLAVTLAVGVICLNAWRSRTQSEEARLERAELKRQFLERAVVARQLAADRKKDWQLEVQGLTRWYFDELASLRARHPGEKRKAPGSEEKDPRRREELREWQKYTAERLALLRPYQVNQDMMKATGKAETVFLHCLPAVKGNEVSMEVIEGPASRVWDESENRKHTIKALMLATL